VSDDTVHPIREGIEIVAGPEPVDNVVPLQQITRLNIPPERVLKSALERDLQSVVVLAYDADGEEYFASSLSDGGTVLWLMERCKKMLLDMPEKLA
jgi:hypothetical protein